MSVFTVPFELTVRDGEIVTIGGTRYRIVARGNETPILEQVASFTVPVAPPVVGPVNRHERRAAAARARRVR